jgi:hypothetical protein
MSVKLEHIFSERLVWGFEALFSGGKERGWITPQTPKSVDGLERTRIHEKRQYSAAGITQRGKLTAG